MGKRTYGDACGIPRALDRIGERWALMVVRELMLGPKRFTDLRAGLPHLSPDVLSQRLRELEESGIVARRTLPPPAASKVYELTEWGRELEEVLVALGRWGARAPIGPEECCTSVDAHVLSLRTLFDPELAGDLDATVELRLGAAVYSATVADGRFEAARGPAADPDATLICPDPATLLDVAHGRRDLKDALDSGDLAIEGGRRVGRRFLRLFRLPDPAPYPQAPAPARDAVSA